FSRGRRTTMKTRTVKAGRQLIDLVTLCYHADEPLLLVGTHGIGKSEILEQAAAELGIGYIVRDLSLMEPPDLVGMPKSDGKVTRYLPPAFLPTDGKGLLVFEELNRCPSYMRGPCLQLLTARCLNDYQLPKGWLPVAAINPADADYEVEELDPALLSRFTCVRVVPDKKEWLAWGEARGLHQDVLGYVASDPKIFSDTNPRSWTKVSRHLRAAEEEGAAKNILEAAVAGCVGTERAVAFHKHRKGVVETPPTAKELLGDYARPG